MSFKPVSIHHAKVPELVFLTEEACSTDSRKRALVFVDRKNEERTNLVAFSSLLDSHPVLSKLQRGQTVATRVLQEAQKESTNAFRDAYGREDWVVGDWRAYQACLEISSRLDVPLVFEFCGKGAGTYEQVARSRARDQTKFDIKVTNPANGKYFMLEASGNNLGNFEMNTIWVQEQKMAWARRNPQELAVMALVHGEFKAGAKSAVDDGSTFIKYLPLNERSYRRSIPRRGATSVDVAFYGARADGGYDHDPLILERMNKSGVPERFLQFDARSCPEVKYLETINLGDFFAGLAKHLSDKQSYVGLRAKSHAKPDYQACAHLCPPPELLSWAKAQKVFEQSQRPARAAAKSGPVKPGAAPGRHKSKGVGREGR